MPGRKTILQGNRTERLKSVSGLLVFRMFWGIIMIYICG